MHHYDALESKVKGNYKIKILVDQNDTCNIHSTLLYL